MARYGRDRGRITTDQTQANEHPIRQLILALFTRDTWRPLEPDMLSADLIETFPDVREEDAAPAQITYHVAVLRNAELLPD